jgi:hypothetical protein
MSDPRGTLAALQDGVIERRRVLAFTALAGTALYAQLKGDDADAAECTFASFVVEDGRPGAEIDRLPGPNPPKVGRVDCSPV